jgi:hypothetical protein
VNVKAVEVVLDAPPLVMQLKTYKLTGNDEKIANVCDDPTPGANIGTLTKNLAFHPKATLAELIGGNVIEYNVVRVENSISYDEKYLVIPPLGANKFNVDVAPLITANMPN